MRANLKAPQFLKIERYAQRLSHRVCMGDEAPGDGLLLTVIALPLSLGPVSLKESIVLKK